MLLGGIGALLPEFADTELVGERDNGVEGEGHGFGGFAIGIGEAVEGTAVTNECAGQKVLELESFDVEHAAGFRISSKEHLESAIEKEAVYAVGADASAGCFTGLEQLYVLAGCVEITGTGQASEAGADDNCIVLFL